MAPGKRLGWMHGMVACLVVAAAGCGRSEPVETSMTNDAQSQSEPPPASDDAMAAANKSILDEVNAAGTWFHAKKTAGIWAKVLEEPQTVQTLEGPMQAEPGDYLCRGAAGELWPQSAESVKKKYVSTEEVDDDGFRKYVPDPNAKGVMAAQVDHPFEVTASWGLLEGKAGDFLIKGFDDKDVEYPEDVWLVDAELFRETYEKVGE